MRADGDGPILLINPPFQAEKAMRPIIAALALALLLVPTAAPCADQQALQDQGKKIASQFFKELVSELRKGMRGGGPVNAIGVCNVEAPKIAARVSAETAWKVGRTSLKLRNPANKPDEWELSVLKKFQAKTEAGENPRDLVYSEIVEVDGYKVFRMMKGIPTGGVCLNCHGPNVKPKVRQKLAELYPEDQATGFAKGTLRGAFTLSKPLD